MKIGDKVKLIDVDCCNMITGGEVLEITAFEIIVKTFSDYEWRFDKKNMLSPSGGVRLEVQP